MAAHTLRTQGRCQAWPVDLLLQPVAGWLAIRTKPRAEKRQALALQAAGIAGCLFLEDKVVRYAKGTVTRSLPLLPAWVFAVGGAAERERIFAQGHALSVEFSAQPQQLGKELLHLAQLLALANGPVVFRPELSPGQMVQISQGTFAGCSAVIERRIGACTLVLRLQNLGLNVAAEVPADWVA